MYNFVIYDTSNYIDFPIGGQLTSISNFLNYIAEYQSDYCSKILLIGLTNKNTELGKKSVVKINEMQFDFLPVIYRDTNLENVKNSLRVEFLKGLFKYRRQIPNEKGVLHYIHTPEAFIQIKLCHPSAKTVIFSHGSFFNMAKGFRFFQNNKMIKFCFETFLKWMLKRANLIFVLDEDSYRQYSKYNTNVIKVNNSIILPEEDFANKQLHNPIKLLFVGRLSKIKRVDEIIRAVEDCDENVMLTIAGDGEEREYLESLAKNRIIFKGALKPKQVREEMKQSDILVMNSVLEGKPMAIIEAMSCGLPIITTNVGGISELVSFGENAIETDGKSSSIIEAIAKIKLDYNHFSQSATRMADEFDYRKVNLVIFNRLKDCYDNK